ncbi:MAG TPA: pimeloyl-ACP methyl ester esterase BioH [Gammaproteobacteria bacterium]
MSLQIETQGNGPDLVLVHGWGVNSGVWQPVLPLLRQHYRVSCVDLPGHGASRDVPMPSTLEAVAQQVLQVTPMSAVWLGWSLGGLICMQIAIQAAARVRALVLSNVTPRFVMAPDWPHAMPPHQLEAFAAELAGDFAGTVRRFLGLQVLGDERARDTLPVLRDSVRARGAPDTVSLSVALDILRDSDLRGELHRINVPTLVMSGAYDRLTPALAGQFIASRIPGAEFSCFPRTAHAPFISHPADFLRMLNGFVQTAVSNSNQSHDHAN